MTEQSRMRGISAIGVSFQRGPVGPKCGRSRPGGRAVDSSDTPFRNMRKRSVFSLLFQGFHHADREVFSRFDRH